MGIKVERKGREKTTHDNTATLSSLCQFRFNLEFGCFGLSDRVDRTIEFQKSYSFTILKSTFESSIDRKHEAKKTTQFTEFVCPYKTFKQLILFCCFF